MAVGLFSKPARILALYFVLVALVYIESDSFRQQAPLLVSLPYLTLGFCTMNLTMPEKKRYLTAIWLLLTAISFYFVSTKRSIPQWTSLIMSFGKTAYLLTFVDCIALQLEQRALFTNLDLKTGRIQIRQAAFIRFVGTLLLLLCSSIVLINEFADRIHGLFACYLLYAAFLNEYASDYWINDDDNSLPLRELPAISLLIELTQHYNTILRLLLFLVPLNCGYCHRITLKIAAVELNRTAL
ncbi:hypothetical protein DINM_005085 [Dirofilaria immitis]|nr:hypothetical protein [Dirofilaria immitis]